MMRMHHRHLFFLKVCNFQCTRICQQMFYLIICIYKFNITCFTQCYFHLHVLQLWLFVENPYK